MCSVRTLDSKRDEGLAHKHFGAYRDVGEFFNVPAETVRRYFEDVIKPLYMHECGYDDPDAVTWAADAAVAAADAAAANRFTDAGVEVEDVVVDAEGAAAAATAAGTATRVVKSNAADVRHQRRLELQAARTADEVVIDELRPRLRAFLEERIVASEVSVAPSFAHPCLCKGPLWLLCGSHFRCTVT
jgi:hypothetical protein